MAGTVSISGRAIADALVAATLVGGAEGIIGGLLAKWLVKPHALSTDADRSWRSAAMGPNQGMPKPKNEQHILNRHSSGDVHVHDIPVASWIGSDESVLLERSPHRRKR
jgi:Na+/glutamate symporter